MPFSEGPRGSPDCSHSIRHGQADWPCWFTDVDETLASQGGPTTADAADGLSAADDRQVGDFDPETLLAIREAIKAEGFGDRKYLREHIGDLAAAKRKGS